MGSHPDRAHGESATGRPTPRGRSDARNDGSVLVVDEGGSTSIDTFVVGGNGKAGPATTTPSVGGGPFGFDFDRAGHLLVSDAALTTGQSGATSYDVASDGAVTANGPAVPIDQAAACWLAAPGRAGGNNRQAHARWAGHGPHRG